MSTPTTEPATFTAGDTVLWTKSLSDYPASAGWTLTYQFRGPSLPAAIVASASSDDFLATVSATASGLYIAGDYWWTSFVAKSGQRFTVGNGQTKVLPNPATLTTGEVYDGRSTVKQTLDAIEAMLLGTASREESSYQIMSGGMQRRLDLFPRAELIQLHSYYLGLYQSEQQAAQLAAGLGNSRRIATRFSTPA